MPEDWQERRREAALEHAATLERRRAAETREAQVLVEDFATTARSRGLRAPAALQGDFYVMSAASSLHSRLMGTTLDPSDPPLAAGVGARDGESMPLSELLRLRLVAGDEWPAPT